MKRHEAEVWRLLQSTLCRLLAAGAASYVRAEDAPADPQTERRLTHMNLEELGNTEVTTVSKEPVKVARTPAAIYVITHDDIQRSGATSIPEALRLTSGVNIMWRSTGD